MNQDRLTPIPPGDWPDQMREAMAALSVPNPRHPFPPRDPDRPKGLGALGLLAHHPTLATAFNAFNGHVLFGTTLSERQRELVILRVAHLRDSEYEWVQHAILAGDVGIAGEEVDAIRSGDTDRFSSGEAALVAAVDELIDDARIGEETWVTLTAEFDTAQVMDLIFTVGAYDALAMAFNTFDLELDPDLRDRAR